MSKSHTVSSMRHAGGIVVLTMALLITPGLAPVAARAVVGEWEIHGPPGNVEALAIAPSDPGVIYGGQGSGVIRSTDGGRSWRGANGNLPLGTGVVDIGVDPTEPSTVYLATVTTGVYKTTDGGRTWEQRNEGLLTLTMEAIATDRTDPDTLYVGGRSGSHVLYKSTDGANSWADISVEDMGFSIQGIAIDPGEHETLYVGVSQDARVLKSTDGGKTWTKAARGIPGDAFIQALAVDPSNPEVVWAGAIVDPPTLYRTSDGGATWLPVAGDLITRAVNDFAFDPIDPESLYVASDGGVYMTTDGGGGWMRLDAAPSSADAVEVDPVHPSTLLASQRTGLAGANVGVFRSTDGGATWKQYTEGVPGGVTDAVAFDPTNPGVVYAGYEAQDPRIYKSTDGGRRWTPYRMGVPGPMLFSGLLIDPTRLSTLYAANEGPGGLLKSTNAGRTWRVSNDGMGGGFLYGLAMDPADPAHLVAAGEKVFESTDGAGSWHPIGDLGTAVDSAAIHPSDPGIIYVGTLGSQFESGGLFKTTDGGAQWRRLFRVPGEFRDVADVEIDPSDPGTVYAAVESHEAAGYIMKSTDAGKTWAQILVDSVAGDIHDLAIAPADTSTIWAGTNNGAYVSYDAGLHWTAWSDGLRSERVEAIVMNDTGTLLYAANADGGVARLVVP